MKDCISCGQFYNGLCKPNPSVLEIGSGVLKSTIHLKNALHFDIDKNAYCLECQGDCHKLPFQDSSFDVIYIAHVLEHCINPAAVLKELGRVARKKIIIKVPNRQFFKDFTEDNGHIFSWTPFTLSNLLTSVFANKLVAVRTNFHVRKGGNKPLTVYYQFIYAAKSLLTGSLSEIEAEVLLNG